MTKKITVITYDDDGRFRVRMNLTLKKQIAGSQDFTLREVQRIVSGQDVKRPYSVEYTFEGRPDGYAVFK